jgi:hypothetical protein
MRLHAGDVATMQPTAGIHNVDRHFLVLVLKLGLLNVFFKGHSAKVATIIVDTTFVVML